MTGWRSNWLRQGELYQVILDKTGHMNTIQKGQKLKYIKAAYSAYDASTIHIFQNLDGESFFLEIKDDENDDPSRHFTELN